MRVDILDENEILLAQIIPTVAKPEIFKPLPTLRPTEPIKISETSINILFVFNFYTSFYNILYQFKVTLIYSHDRVFQFDNSNF